MNIDAKKKYTIQILDFWHMLSFLSQDDFRKPSQTMKTNVQTWKRKGFHQETRTKKENWFETLDEESDLDSILKNVYDITGWAYHGKISIYYGRVNRDDCIELIADKLHEEKDNDEKTGNQIALMSLQLRSDGTYIPDSFSLSPVVWAIGRIGGKDNVTSAEVLSIDSYLKDVAEIEEELQDRSQSANNISDETDDEENNDAVDEDDKDDDNETENEEETSDDAEEEPQYESLNDNAVDMSLITSIAQKIVSKYLNEKVKCQMNGTMFFSTAPKRETLDNDDSENDYISLSNDYYSRVIETLRREVTDKNYGKNPMDMAILDYICAPYRELNTPEKELMAGRTEVVHPDSITDFQNFADNILNIKNAPLGKWPERFTHAMMQQIAINEAASLYKKKDGTPVFSVNGPPGTGKTTMLKDIIANNIVERANLLADYKKPDDAFITCNFSDGPEQNNAYIKYYQHYYKLKNDKINDYGILVASYNNTAVENITKEIPTLSKLQDGLKTDPDKDDKATIDALEEISSLFDPEKSDETIYSGTKSSPQKDIYFTQYGNTFFEKSDFDEKVWGMISARLGRRSNVKKYCNYLNNLLHAPLKSLKSLNKNNPELNLQENWETAAAEYKKQYEKVQMMQSDIETYCNQMTVLHSQSAQPLKKREELLKEKSECEANLTRLKTSLPGLKKAVEKAEKELNISKQELLDPAENELSVFNQKYNPVYEEYTKNKEEHDQLKDSLSKTKDHISLLQAFIHKTQSDLAQAESEVPALQKKVDDQRNQLAHEQQKLSEIKNNNDINNQKLADIQSKIDADNKGISDIHDLGFFKRISRENKAKVKALQEDITQNQETLAKLQEESNSINQQLEEQTAVVKSSADALSEAFNNAENLKKTIGDLNDKLKKNQESLTNEQNAVPDFEKKEDQAKQLLQKAEEKLDPLQPEHDRLTGIAENARQRHNHFVESKDNADKDLSDAQNTCNDLTSRIDEINKELKTVEEEINDNFTEQSKIKDLVNKDPFMKGALAADTRYYMDAVSKDIAASTKAQTEDPWLPFEYEREREKLFRLAIKVNKNFILASKCCRDNLEHYYAYEQFNYPGSPTEISFTANDRKAAVSAMYQTVFLLTPVISTTFASVGRLLKDVQPHQLGTLIVDEAGQAEPQNALGTMRCCRYAIIVGDPKQIEPIVHDDLSLLKKAFSGNVYAAYKSPENSVQRSADFMNPIGSVSDENISGSQSWIGCPLLVHRRCISPMYEISNELSYNGTMKQQTPPPSEEKEQLFAGRGSRWYQIKGSETNGHGVEKQNECAAEILEEAFAKALENNKEPSIFVIAPFRTVVSSFSTYVRRWASTNRNSAIAAFGRTHELNKWLSHNVGTVHTFQGKEADQVIFILGCDRKTRSRTVKWVGRNIVNVAVTRAKYRLFAVGDVEVWKQNDNVSLMMRHLFLYNWAELHNLTDKGPEYSRKAAELMTNLPDASSFDIAETTDASGHKDLIIHNSRQIKELGSSSFLHELTDADLQPLGINKEMLGKWNPAVTVGLQTYFTLGPIVQKANLQKGILLAPEPGIVLCRGLESQLKDSLTDFFKSSLPNYKININHRDMILADCSAKDMTIGTYSHIIKNNSVQLAERAAHAGHKEFDASWWISFNNQLFELSKLRNDCCHVTLPNDPESKKYQFTWPRLQNLITLLFIHGNSGRFSMLDTGIMQACDQIKEALQ